MNILVFFFWKYVDRKWLEKAQNELGECEETRAIKLRLLEERIVQDKNIPNTRRDNAFLLRFLRAKKFDVDKSFRMVLTFSSILFMNKDMNFLWI